MEAASAAQLVPAIIHKTKSVTQFMRVCTHHLLLYNLANRNHRQSPHHIVDATNHQISPEWRTIFRRIPLLLYLVRLILFLYMEMTWFRFQNNKLGKIGRASVENKSRRYVQDTAPGMTLPYPDPTPTRLSVVLPRLAWL